MKKIVSIIVCALLIVVAGFVAINKYNKYTEDKAVTAFKNKAVAIKTVKYNSDYEDLAGLEPILKDKNIVAMGEATHGTKEFFQMKHRMFQFLVEKMGYNVFAIEASMADCAAVNDYILSGKGDAKLVVKGMKFWTWDTKEVLDMVEWMKEYNKSHTEKIKFYGFDMQSTQTAAKNITEYLKKVDPHYEVQVDNALSKFNDNALDYGVKEELPIDKINEIIKAFERNRDEYIKKSSMEQYELSKEYLNTICEFYDAFGTKQSDFQIETKRDKYMAENVKWIVEHEKNRKIMLWAHNVHVSKGIENTNDIASEYPEGNVKRMGSNLYDMYGDKMYVIGFEFNKGSFRANIKNKENGQTANQVCTVKEAKVQSAAYIFSKVNPLFFIDFKTCRQDKYAKKFLSAAQKCHDIGAGFSGEDTAFKSRILNVRYDGLLFVDTTNSAEPN